MTPVAGLLSDKCNTPIGQRTPWYIFGSIIVLPTWIAYFSYPTFINNLDGTPAASQHAKDLWYVIMPALCNAGWASTQIANMSIVNSITRSTKHRDVLISNRNGFTSAAFVTVLVSAIIIFNVVDDDL